MHSLDTRGVMQEVRMQHLTSRQTWWGHRAAHKSQGKAITLCFLYLTLEKTM